MKLPALSRLRADGPIDLEVLLRQAVDEVVRLLGADRGTIYLVDHVRGELVSRVAHLPELAEIRLRLGEGIAGTAAREGRVVNVARGGEHPSFAPRFDAATGYRTQSVLAVPVRTAEEGRTEVVGVLQVLNKAGGEGSFDERDVALAEELADEVAQLLAATSLRSQLRPSHRLPLAFRFNHIVGESRAMQEVFERTARAARTDATVLVRGESGSGKEIVARAVHWNSPRCKGPFVKVDCAALPAGLIENELFGHERGAFTGANRTAEGKVRAAHGGTLFLDEIGELPASVQGKLLRLLQERTFLRVGGTEPQEVDLRFVCATHRDLEAEVAAGRFRQDLYYRLRVVQIDLPPLRARGAADLDRLIDHFHFEFTRRHRRPELLLGEEARRALHRHGWPGNVRELEHCIEAAVVLCPGEVIGPEHLPLPAKAAGPSGEEAGAVAATASGEGPVFSCGVLPLRELERIYVRFVLDAHGGNRSAAARTLGIGRNTLARKLKP
ncbi:MAG: sigma-54-dependent Fis family transcriptional regulator [Planctomycetota bacterium]|nr:MAG: sigma-54-dependent Fis family transcriptional regulator [Planctomycetota bacterium]